MVERHGNILVELIVVVGQVIQSIVTSVFHAVLKSPREKCIRGEVALITGGGSGIGRLLAVQLAKRGATVVSWDVDAEGNAETARLVRDAASNSGPKCHTYTIDVSKRHLVEEYGRRVCSEVGEVSILINNAGTVTGKTILNSTEETILKTFEVNLFSQFWTIKQFVPRMLKLPRAHIVNISSMLALEALGGVADYAGSKAAGARLNETLVAELSKMGITHIKTTTVFPYLINTKLFAGCRIRFPWLLPPLDAQQATNRIVRAILTNQKVLYMPRLFYFIMVLKSMLPVEAGLILHDFIGSTNFMDSHVGRKKAE